MNSGGIYGAGRWAPPYLGSALWLWLDSRYVELTSGKVSKWIDMSGKGFDAVQASTARQPTYLASYTHGRPGLDMRASGINVAASFGTTLSQPCEIWFVATSDAPTAGAPLIDGIDSVNRVQARKTNSLGGNAFYITAGGTDNPHPVTPITWNVPHIHRCVYFDDKTGEIHIDGVQQTLTPSTIIGTNTTQGMTIGSFYDGSGTSNSTFGEVLVFSGKLSTTDASRLTSYLKTKWAIT